MSRTFKIDKCPYDEGDQLYTNSDITLSPGITVLVGCNGSGKSTLLHSIEDIVKNQGLPIISYNNLSDGGSTSISESIMLNDIAMAASLMISSEGEQIATNMARFSSEVGIFLRKHKSQKEAYILIDAVDSGLSIDNISDLKQYLFHTIIDDIANTPHREVYIIVSANTYEMCIDEQCLDVRTGKYMQFKTYAEYRDFVIKSREYRDKRFEN